MQTKNAEIKLLTQQKGNEMLTETNNKLQDKLNSHMAKNENLERELNTTKEILR